MRAVTVLTFLYIYVSEKEKRKVNRQEMWTETTEKHISILDMVGFSVVSEELDEGEGENYV